MATLQWFVLPGALFRIQGYKNLRQWHNLNKNAAPGGSGPKAQLHTHIQCVP